MFGAIHSIISNYADFLTRGFNQAFDVKTCASHFAMIDDPVSHYRRAFDLNYIKIRYEDLASDQESNVRKLWNSSVRLAGNGAAP